MGKYGPNGEYETLNDFFNANPSAKRSRDQAVEKAMKENEAKVKEQAEKARQEALAKRGISSTGALQTSGYRTSQPRYTESYASKPKITAYAQYTSQDIDITYSQVEENIAKLKSAVNTLRSIWDGEAKENLTIIENSWAGDDCSAYIQKLKNMNSRVQNTISALDYLRDTFEQARDMVKSSQQNTISSIANNL